MSVEKRMEKMYQRSYLGRSMDPVTYPYHRAILLLALIAGVIGGAVCWFSGSDLLSAAIGGFYAGAAVFLAWVLARELDPDLERSAFFGAMLAFFAWLFLGNPAIIPLYLMILSIRMVNRTVGPPLKLGDLVAIFVAVLLAVFLGGWVYGTIAALAYLLDALLNEPNRRSWLFVSLSLLAALIAILIRGFALFEVPTSQALIFSIVAGLCGLLLIFLIRKLEAVGDFRKQPLDLTRVRAGIFLAAFSVLAVLWYGDSGVAALAPLAAGIIGSALYRLLPLENKT